jgi:uncharacterized protein
MPNLDATIEHILQDLRTGLQTIYGERLKAVILYGSQARGDARPGWESDVDVAFVLDDFADSWEEIRRTGQLVSELSLAYDITISPLPFREREWREAESPLMLNIRREGVLVR